MGFVVHELGVAWLLETAPVESELPTVLVELPMDSEWDAFLSELVAA